MPLISIITINYNNAIGLQKTIESVIDQSFQDFEFIVIDGNSTDTSVDAIKANQRINYWVSETDSGIYNAQNKGLDKAKGDYFLFLNSGDCLADKDTLKNVSGYLDSTGIVYGDLITRAADGVKTHEESPDNADVYHFMISTLWHPCAFIHRTVFEKAGKYNEAFKITADYEFFIRAILKHGVSSKHIPVPVSVFDLSGISNDPANDALQLEERRRSWDVNFSPVVVNTFEAYTQLLRSGEYKLGKKIKEFKNLFGKK